PQPVPALPQVRDAALLAPAVGHRPDVEQVVPPLARDVEEFEEDLARAFPVVVILLVAPGVVDGRGSLPRLVRGLVGDGVVAGASVVALFAGETEAGVAHAVGRARADHLDGADG